MSRLTFILITTVAYACLWDGPVRAQSQKSTENAPHATDSWVRLQVKKLTSPIFAERQQAAKNLLGIELESVAMLESLASEASGEADIRLKTILTQVRKRLFDDQLDAFLKNPSVEIAQRLPQWDRFQSLCGDQEDALKIYGEILHTERRLFAARLFAPKDVSVLLENRTAELSRRFNGNVGEDFPVASVAAVMLLGSESQTRLIRATSTNISDALDDPRFNQLISEGVHAKTLQAIVESWVVRPGIAAERPLLFAMQHSLKSGSVVARRIIESGSSRPDMILSLLCLAKLNSTEDLQLIEDLMDNKTVLWPQRGQVVKMRSPDQLPFDTNYKVQTRDVALITAVTLRGLSPEQVGFKDVRESAETLYAIDSIGFSSDEARDKAVTIYRQLQSK